MAQFYFDGELFWPHLLQHKVVRPEFIRELTPAQLRLFIDVSILGDGQGNCIYQNSDEQLFAVQMAATLLGISTSIKRRSDGQYVLSLLTKTYAGVRAMQSQEVAYEGEVWCVATGNKNWLARRRGSVYYTGNTYDLGEKEFRVVWDDLMRRKLLIKDKRIKKAYNKRSGEMYIEFPWGTRLEVRSADHPENLVGEALDGVIISEAAKQKVDTWKRYIRPALSDKRGFATFPTTPEGFNWLYNLWQYGQDPTKPLYESWQFPSWDNTAVYPGGRTDPEIQDLEETTQKEWFAQEIGAEFSAFVGKIYSEFKEQIHVKPTPFDPALPNYMACDWGWANPAAFVEFQVTPQDKVRVWRVHYAPWMTLAQHFKAMRERPQPEGYHLDLAFGDAADPEACATMSQNFCPCICAPEAKVNWRQGIELVKKFLAVTTIAVHLGAPTPTPNNTTEIYTSKFQMDNSCKEGIIEFNNYKTKEPIHGNNVPEMGQKTMDHFLDALRYGLMHVFVLGSNYHLDDLYDTNGYSLQDAIYQHRSYASQDAPLLVPDAARKLDDVAREAHEAMLDNMAMVGLDQDTNGNGDSPASSFFDMEMRF
jgi:hypothetical protein